MKEARFPWVAVAVVVGVVMLALAIWLRLPPEPPRLATGGGPELRIDTRAQWRGGGAMAEQLRLLDPTPLFLPTALSYADVEPPGIGLDEATGAVAAIPPRFFRDDIRLATTDTQTGQPARAESLLAAMESRSMFGGLGEVDAVITPLPARVACVDAMQMSDGSRVLRWELSEVELTADRFGADWQPLIFAVTVDAAGLLGSPALVRSSGNQDVDDFFREYLLKTRPIAAVLPPGFYRVQVGP